MLTTDQRRLLVRKRLRPFRDEYEVRAEPSGDPVAYARKARFAPELSVYRNDSRAEVLCTARAGTPVTVIEVEAAEPLGRIRLEQVWGPRVWHVEPAAGEPVRGSERSRIGAVLGSLFGRVPAHFDFTADERTAFTVRRRFGLHRRYLVDIADDSLDRRLVVAQVLALDAF